MISERHHFLISEKNIRGNRFELNGCTDEVHDIWLIVGPEGGYFKEERKLISKTGIPIVSLSPRRLRSETAAIVALAICDNYFAVEKSA